MESHAAPLRCHKRKRFARKLPGETLNNEATPNQIVDKEKMLEGLGLVKHFSKVIDPCDLVSKVIDPCDLDLHRCSDIEHCYSRKRKEEHVVTCTAVSSDISVAHSSSSNGEVSAQTLNPVAVKTKGRMAELRIKKKIKAEKLALRKRNLAIIKSKKECVKNDTTLGEPIIPKQNIPKPIISEPIIPEPNIPEPNIPELNIPEEPEPNLENNTNENSILNEQIKFYKKFDSFFNLLEKRNTNGKKFTKSKVIRYVCPVCGKYLCTKIKIINHAKRVHDELFKTGHIMKKKCTLFRCTEPECNSTSYNLTDMNKHIFRHHSDIPPDSKQVKTTPNHVTNQNNSQTHKIKDKSESSEIVTKKTEHCIDYDTVIDVESFMTVTMIESDKNVDVLKKYSPPPTFNSKIPYVTQFNNAFTPLGNSRTKKSNEILEKKIIINKSTVLKCTNCELQFTSHVDISRHFQQMHMSAVKYPKFNCFYCSVVFRSQTQLENHLKYHDSSIIK